jgi:hypothetical protein
LEKFGVTDFTYLITIELHHSPDGNGYPAVGFEKRKDKAGGSAGTRSMSGQQVPAPENTFSAYF